MKEIKLKVNHLVPHSTTSYIRQYLNTLGITKIESFINQPEEEDEENPFYLDNMQLAIETAHQNLSAGEKVFVMVDSDTDGYTSSAILINYIHRRFPNNEIVWKLHKGKEHGIELDMVPADCKLIFIPDAGSNQINEHKKLSEEGKTVIVLDHHEIDDAAEFYSSPAIIVNNQTSKKYKNKSLSGAGVVYKFIKGMDKLFYKTEPIYHDYGDLAAIGIIADAMNMTTLDNNYIAFWGLSHIHNKFIKALALKQSRGIKNPNILTKIDVAFYIAPVINGVIRSGSAEDKEMTFNALITNDDDNTYPHVWRGVTTYETLWERAARNAINAKSRQDSAKKKSFEWLCEKIRAEGLDKHNIVIVPLNEKESIKVNANITGLIAMELVKEFNKPCLVLRQTTMNDLNGYGGSGRNGNFYKLPDLKSQLLKYNAYFCSGHSNAFGVFLLPSQIKTITENFDNDFNASVFEDTVYEVDYWFHTGETIDTQMLMEIASYDDLWGNSIPQPKFAFDINYNSNQIKLMGANNDSLKIHYDGIDFVAFKCPEIIKQLQEKECGHISIVGRAQINEWMGRKSVQIIIDDIEINAENTISLQDLI